VDKQGAVKDPELSGAIARRIELLGILDDQLRKATCANDYLFIARTYGKLRLWERARRIRKEALSNMEFLKVKGRKEFIAEIKVGNADITYAASKNSCMSLSTSMRSADKLSAEVIHWFGKLWVVTGSVGRGGQDLEADLMECVPINEYHGTIPRKSKNSYIGVMFLHKRIRYVILDKLLTLIYDPEIKDFKQLDMFTDWQPKKGARNGKAFRFTDDHARPGKKRPKTISKISTR